MADRAPRSFEELSSLIRKDGGWVASVGSHAPYRLLEDLIARADAFPPTFRERDLPAAALLATRTFLESTRHFRPPRVEQLLQQLPTEAERQQATAAVEIIEAAVTALGPIDRWGSTHPDRLPSATQRLEALTIAVERAHIGVGLATFSRFADMADAFGLAECPRGPDAPWRSTAAVTETIRQAIGLLYDQAALSVAFQEFADSVSLAIPSATDPDVISSGGMLVDLTRAMLALRPPRTGPRGAENDTARIEVEAAIRQIATHALPSLAPKEKWIERAVTWLPTVATVIKTVAAALLPPAAPFAALASHASAATSGAASGHLLPLLDKWQTHALKNAVTAAGLIAPVYTAAIPGRKRVRAPDQLVGESKYAALYAAVSALRLTTFRSKDECLALPALAHTPMTYLIEKRREGDAHRAVWQFLQRTRELNADAGLGGTLASADDLVIARGAQRTGRPLLGEGVSPRGVHAAAIAVLQLRRGVPLAQLEDDLAKGRLPGVRGTCRGDSQLVDGASHVWDLPHALSAPDQLLVQRAIRAADLERVVATASRSHSGWLPGAVRPIVGLENPGERLMMLAGNAHQQEPHARTTPSLDTTHTYHRGPVADGLPGLLITEWAARFTDGRVRVRPEGGEGLPVFVRLAVLDAHETAAFLAGPAQAPQFDRACSVAWREAPRSLVGPPTARWQLDTATPGVVTDVYVIPIRGHAATPARVEVEIIGLLPPAAQDVFAAVGTRPPPALGLPPRNSRRPLQEATLLAEGTQPHQSQLAASAATLIAQHPVRGAARVRSLAPAPRVESLSAPHAPLAIAGAVRAVAPAQST